MHIADAYGGEPIVFRRRSLAVLIVAAAYCLPVLEQGAGMLEAAADGNDAK